jgi:hypothetical protein
MPSAPTLLVCRAAVVEGDHEDGGAIDHHSLTARFNLDRILNYQCTCVLIPLHLLLHIWFWVLGLIRACVATEKDLQPTSDIKRVRTPQGYHLAIRYSGWATSASQGIEESPLLSNEHSPRHRSYPVCIPNGLAATMVATSRIHDQLVAAGFQVPLHPIKHIERSLVCCC